MRYIGLFLAVCVLCASSSAYAQSSLTTMMGKSPESEVRAIADEFFSILERHDVQTAMNRIFAIFPLNPEAQNGFVNDVTNLKVKLGTPTGHEFIKSKTFGSCNRYLLVYYMTFHPRMPVAWEFTFYLPQPGAPWQLNFIRFDADDVREFLEFPKLQFDALRRQNADQTAMPAAMPAEHLSEPPAPAVGEVMPAGQ